jgi:2-phospho-L-lactate guanylyltransferase
MILVPVKNLSNAKQRLSSVLNNAGRHELALAMLEDILTALAACSRRSQVALVTADAEAIRLAEQFSFEVIKDWSNQGESIAVHIGTCACEVRGEAETLVLPGDIPLVTADEIDRIFRMAPPAGTVIVPSRDMRGSNAILRRPAALFPLEFGYDSFHPHLRAARLSGEPCIVLKLDGIALDVDGPADLAELIARPGNTRAQQFARDWRIAARVAAAAIRA